MAYMVYKAFVIKGGTQSQRDAKFDELATGDVLSICGHFTNSAHPDELGVFFTTQHQDDMTFEKVRELAGKEILPSDFTTSAFGGEPRFGIISLG